VIWAASNFAGHVEARTSRPQQAAKSAWAYVDGRDAARGVRLALEAEATGSTVLNITSRSAFCDRPIGDLVREWYGLDLPPELGDRPDAAIFDWRKAAAAIGFRSRYRWSSDGIIDLGAGEDSAAAD
jgi:nucleoside-diphosphate-sugar epimerase